MRTKMKALCKSQMSCKNELLSGPAALGILRMGFMSLGVFLNVPEQRARDKWTGPCT